MQDNSTLDRLTERREFDKPRAEDWRSDYARDRARIIHSSSFRRLQGKTQVMGAGENDFHRTRLTHSLEVAQIGLGLFKGLQVKGTLPPGMKPYVKGGRSVLAAACYAHDLGHPPYGHGGEKALHEKMKRHGGFEGNAHTIRLLTKLEKYNIKYGVNPTRRVLLSVLKYPVSFSDYPMKQQEGNKPPKCYFSCDRDAIEWVLEPFSTKDKEAFQAFTTDEKGNKKPLHKSFDASIMECGDDIAYCAHDLEDIVARKLVEQGELIGCVKDFFGSRVMVGCSGNSFGLNDFENLFRGSYTRKDAIGKLVNILMTNTEVISFDEFDHPILRYRLTIRRDFQEFVTFLKEKLTYGLVVKKPEIQMLERKGQKLIKMLFDEFISAPEYLIPKWEEPADDMTRHRNVCDYIAGMTDAYSTKIYHRLFTPGFGSSRDEL